VILVVTVAGGMFSSIWVATVCVLDLRAFISRAPQPWLAATKEGTTHDGEDRSLCADCRWRWGAICVTRNGCSISQVGAHWGAAAAAAGLSAAGVILRDCPLSCGSVLHPRVRWNA
jgi:hypothetical protein